MPLPASLVQPHTAQEASLYCPFSFPMGMGVGSAGRPFAWGTYLPNWYYLKDLNTEFRAC